MAIPIEKHQRLLRRDSDAQIIRQIFHAIFYNPGTVKFPLPARFADNYSSNFAQIGA